MTEKDKQLIAEAEQIHWTRWEKVMFLRDQAESEEAKRELNGIITRLCCQEEAACGMI